ncbi:MAG: AMP-binding protein, partial [Gemmatimonadota bacterium]|nr:AMP-binding protein [Gemmatimonadota bacterium]
MAKKTIDALLHENRTFLPPPELAENAVVSDPAVYETARDSEAFWAEQAASFEWSSPWEKVLDWDCPWAKWFVGGKLNITVNCLDRHVRTWRRNKAAFIWEGEPGDQRVLTYADLLREVSRFANVLKSLGVGKGDRVTIYLGMVPELPIAMLACARIGAAHSVIFGGFSPESIRERVIDSDSKVVVTADGGWRRGNIVPLKRNTDEALEQCPGVEHVVVVRRIGDAANAPMHEGRDHWWHDLMAAAGSKCAPEVMDAEDLLYILYTSGTTGKPKGIAHTTGGYMVGTAVTHRWVFDLREEDVYWCTADIGWVTGHSYIVYGPLANGATGVMYEGSPDWPRKDRFWEIVEKYGVSIFYTAPTAIRT